MTTHIAEAAGSWRTRVGVLLVLLVAVAAGVFALNRAEASFTASPTIAQSPAAASQPVGTAVTFTATVDHQAANMSGTVVISIPAGYTNIANGTCATDGGAGTGGSVVFDGGSPSATTGPATVTCNVTIAGGDGTAGTITMTATANIAAEGTVAGASMTATGGLSAGPTTGYSATNPVTASPASDTNALGLNHTITFGLPQNVGCQSDADAEDDADRECTAADVVLDGATLVSGPTVADSDIDNSSNVTVVVRSAAVGSHDIQLLVVANSGDGTAGNEVDFTSQTATKAYVAAELRHMNGGTVLTAQDIPNDVRGHRHTVCVVAADTGIDLNADGDFTDTNEVAPVALTIPLTSFNQLNVTAGGGHTSINDPDPTFTDPTFFTGNGTNGLNGASCFSWISTEAGDQEITVEYDGDDGVTRTVRWDDDGDNNDNDGVDDDGPSNAAIIKEWNVLEDSTVTVLSGSTVLGTGTGSNDSASSPTVEIDRAAIFNPSNSTYSIGTLTISDKFNGSHVMRTGATWSTKTTGNPGLWGVEVTAWLGTACGQINSADPTSAAPANLGPTGPSGVINLTVTADASCGLNDSILVFIQGQEPDPLGSGDGLKVIEVVKINLTSVVPTKQVFLAWAGQRIILEHDWRLGPGDVDGNASAAAGGDGNSDDDPDPLGSCAFSDNTGSVEDFQVAYIKGSGPGNFLASLGASLNGSDEARVWVSAANRQDDGDVPGGPQDSCISRVLYESEDQGQVDIEAFVTQAWDGESEYTQPESGFNQTKIAFVIYYMKIESVETSLVTSVEKPTHNSSNSLLNDWAPGNPWDVGEDEFATEWNVSKDLLVRVRVKGWFTSSNPSGREQEQKNATGDWLPANRWVMPDDWAVLAGGEAAIQFRPEYDLMIAPNSGAALALPEYAGTTLITTSTTLTAAMTASSTEVKVSADTGAVAGSTISIDAEKMLVVSVSTDKKTLTVVRGAGAAAHAAGAPVLLQVAATTPFEGPYSLLDTRSLTGPSAALSDYDPNNVRKTMFPDGAINMWDAPMPPAMVAVDIRGAGFIKQVLKQDVYYLGTPNSVITQTYPNPYYIQDIPASPWIPANVAGGGYFWNTWGNDGPGGNGDGVYRFWNPIPSLIATVPGKNWAGVSDASLTSAQTTELAGIRTAYGDNTIGRTLVLYTDNHGEAMVAANGDFKLDYSGCATNPVYGTPHCDTGDVVGSSSIFATADYPDFRGKHPPVQSFSAEVDWTWGGYKDVTVEDGETEQFKYVVLHVKDRDGFCAVPTGAVSLHPVIGEDVDFLIDGGQGKIVDSASNGTLSGERGAADGVKTFSTAANTTLKEFPTLDGSTDECQAWIKVSSSLLDIVNVLVTAHDPEGKVGFDVLIDFTSTFQYQLTFRWSLITWVGADGIAPEAALKGEGANAGGTNIFDKVTAVYGWNQDAQAWLGYFPAAAGLPGVNDLTSLQLGVAYWVAVTENTAWTVITDTN